jgi:peptide/nickel transport system substrate-binding protein
MHKATNIALLVVALFLFVSVSCLIPTRPSDTLRDTEDAQKPTDTSNPTSSPITPRLMTICMGQEPGSLFLYGDISVAARNLRQAIYDGPLDIIDYQLSPVILESVPSLANGDALFEPVTVQAGNLIVDGNRELVNLAEGVSFWPAGCGDSSCELTYSGQEAVQLDQQVVRFKLLPNILWSDGEPLTSDDSVFSFEVARDLYPRARSELIAYTASYQAVDALNVEWRGVPGYKDPTYAANFFTPLPRHAWGQLSAEDLLSAEISTRAPLGWGPYVIEEWMQGDHISLTRNSNYFRFAEGLPAFDKLVFRFVPNRDEAIAALLAGECDYLDETVGLESDGEKLIELQQAGKLALTVEMGSSWEHLDFNLAPVDPTIRPALFATKETRQAIATCIDRQSMVNELQFVSSEVPDSYMPASHPLHNPGLRRYEFNPQAAAELFDMAGWVDDDGDLTTPRQSLSVPGVPDGTLFSFTLLTSDDVERLRAAQIIQESLAQCGVQVQISSLDAGTLLAPGPEGPIFGRNFDMAQFGWVTSITPPCFLYTSAEIPGPYPQYPKGWGGSNDTGYSNPDFDQVCRIALSTLPDLSEFQGAHYQAQAIFAEDLPVIPLYLGAKLVAARADMCALNTDPSVESDLWDLENFDYGADCIK